MSDATLTRMFEHNNWANDRLIAACTALTEAQLDAPPRSATQGTIRGTLTHLVAAQHGYLSLLTLPVEERTSLAPALTALREAARASGEGLLALAGNADGAFPTEPLRTRDGHRVAPWVVMVQAINHATEHREQVKSMLTALGETPPDLDGWSFGDAVGALVPLGM